MKKRKKTEVEAMREALMDFSMKMSMASQDLMAKMNALAGIREVRGNEGVLLHVINAKDKAREHR